MDSPEIFDRAARRRHRDRAAIDFAEHAFVREAMLEGIADRLSTVTRRFEHMLEIGSFAGDLPTPSGARVTRCDAGFAFAAESGGVQCDEDRLPFADATFDLVISAGVLDSVNDLPGALTLIRRVLKPDGLFLGAFAGAGSLATLRAALLFGDGDRPSARIHPQVEVRSAGDLLVRAGFALPVADVERLTVRYGNLFSLLADLRGMGAANALKGRRALTRGALARAAEAFAAQADADGRVSERFELVFLTGWTPDPSQPRAARRGSATASLADTLQRQGASPAAGD